MERLDAGTATVSRAVVFHDHGTYLPISVTVGDNCCDEHARLAAERVIKVFADSITDEGPVSIQPLTSDSI